MNINYLSPRQQQVIDSISCPGATTLVSGGPGTGKTTVALLAAKHHLESDASPERGRVLFLTFSRAAVNQLVSSSPGVLSDFSDQIEITTFHALSFRILRTFGRYGGYGETLLAIQSETNRRLFGSDSEKLKYSDLIPGALRLLQDSLRVRRLLSKRWGLIICDEVQDTDEEQWQFVQALGAPQRLLLGDPNQMIYTFRPGVSPEQFDRIRQLSDREIQMEPQSYRDPSGAIPAVAEAIRLRKFDDRAVINAVNKGQLIIHTDIEPEAMLPLIRKEIGDARARGATDIGVFAHKNADVTQISEGLSSLGVEHVIVGTPDAHAEALSCMATQCAYAIGRASELDLSRSLALFLTATVRSKEVPPLAKVLIDQKQLPTLIRVTLSNLRYQLLHESNCRLQDIAEIAAKSWSELGIQAGFRSWRRAAAHFRRLISPIRERTINEESIDSLLQIIDQRSTEYLVEAEAAERGNLKLMNFYQTKGREADTVIHVFHDDDYFGMETEPFESTSRLLNVAVSRARRHVVIILPRNPIPLVKPLARLQQI